MALMLAIIVPLVTAAIFLILFLKLRIFSAEKPTGRFLLLAGALLALFAVVWQMIKPIPVYRTWFLDGVYPFLEWAQFAVVLLASLFGAAGLFRYVQWWRRSLEEYRQREWSGAILTTLFEQSREPKHLLEFLTDALGSCMQEGVDAAAILFVNRSRRHFVLAAGVGFTREETARLEYYPLDRNTLGQALEMEEAAIADSFNFIDQSGMLTVSRFNSAVVLPLVAGQERIGVLLLASEKSKQFGRMHVRALLPVSGWFAERIRSARLQREANTFKEQRQQFISQQEILEERVNRALRIFGNPQSLNEFADLLVGFAGAQDVQICGVLSGSIQLLGQSKQSEAEWSENYRAALTNALDGTKPLVINQEGTTADGRSYIVASTVVYPATAAGQRYALLLRREQAAITLSESELSALQLFSSLAAVLIQYQQLQDLDFGRRKGFDAIIKLIRSENLPPATEDPGFFARQFAHLLRQPSCIVTFSRDTAGAFKAVSAVGLPLARVEELRFDQGDTLLENRAGSKELRFAAEKAEVRSSFEQLSIPNREVLNRLAANYGSPEFLAAVPFEHRGSVDSFALFILYGVSSGERGEWKRLLTLAGALFSLRLNMSVARPSRGSVEPALQSAVEPSLLNELNNHLSVVIGSAELASKRDDLSGEIKNFFDGIVDEAERAAAKIRQISGARPGSKESPEAAKRTGGDFNEMLNSFLSGVRISDTLYMIAGRPREVFVKQTELPAIALADEKITEFAAETLNRFASLASDDDVMTLSTYVKDAYVYFDVSRHRKNFPPVEQVAGFGKYLLAGEAFRFRPADTFLRKVADSESWYAFDAYSAAPSYLSFKFPFEKSSGTGGRQRKILAIDDQPIILDLITAMCASLGYAVRTASSGEEGIRIADSEPFDIILTDLAMPGLSGLETAATIHRRQPRASIVLVTGWEATVSSEELAAAGIARVLYKPFRIEQLTELIQSLIENSSFV